MCEPAPVHRLAPARLFYPRTRCTSASICLYLSCVASARASLASASLVAPYTIYTGTPYSSGGRPLYQVYANRYENSIKHSTGRCDCMFRLFFQQCLSASVVSICISCQTARQGGAPTARKRLGKLLAKRLCSVLVSSQSRTFGCPGRCRSLQRGRHGRVGVSQRQRLFLLLVVP